MASISSFLTVWIKFFNQNIKIILNMLDKVKKCIYLWSVIKKTRLLNNLKFTIMVLGIIFAAVLGISMATRIWVIKDSICK